MHTTDSLGAGSLCNTIHFSHSDINALQRINYDINLVQSGTENISLTNAGSTFAAKLNPPNTETSLHCIRHLKAILHDIISLGHPSVILILEH